MSNQPLELLRYLLTCWQHSSDPELDFGALDLARFPAEAMALFSEARLIKTAGQVAFITCPGCEEECTKPVQYS